MRLLLTDESFIDSLAVLAEMVADQAQSLDDLLHQPSDHGRLLSRMTDLGADVDETCSAIVGRLVGAFATPFDPEDIQALAAELQHVGLLLRRVARRVDAMRLAGPLPAPALLLGDAIVTAMGSLTSGVRDLRNPRRVLDALPAVKHDRDRATRIHDDGVAALFAEGGEPLAVITSKDVYDDLQSVVDQSRRASFALERMALKYV